MATIFGRKKFLKIAKSTFFRYPGVKSFDEIALSRTVKEICVFPFLEKIRKSKMVAIWGREKFFFNFLRVHFFRIPCGSKISRKLLYLAQLRR